MGFRGVLVARPRFLSRLVSGYRVFGGRDELRRYGFQWDPRQVCRTVAGRRGRFVMRNPARLFILVSVVLGVVLVGFAAGRGCDRQGAKRGEDIAALLDRSSLPETRRAELKEKLRAVLPGVEGKKAKRQLREETIAILEAEHFDAAAYRESMNKMLVERQRQKQRIVEVIVETASELNQEERKALADMFRRSSRFRQAARTN